MAINNLEVFCGGCAGCSLCTLLILIIMSFSSIKINEYGLNYSWITKTIEATEYTAGLHFLGIGHRFIRFPKTIITVEFSDSSRGADYPSLRTRTEDGLEVILDISYQFRIYSKELNSSGYGLKGLYY